MYYLISKIIILSSYLFRTIRPLVARFIFVMLHLLHILQPHWNSTELSLSHTVLQNPHLFL